MPLLKKSKLRQVSVNLFADQQKALQSKAKEKNRNVSEIVRHLIAKYLSKI